jgi:hypothetical protein
MVSSPHRGGEKKYWRLIFGNFGCKLCRYLKELSKKPSKIEKDLSSKSGIYTFCGYYTGFSVTYDLQQFMLTAVVASLSFNFY